jgi:hypothetical protein
MIEYVTRRNLDEQRYNQCISSSIKSRIYAHSWYLDLVCEQWGVLVYQNYEAVMPLPWNSKLGLKYITQPFFCQQLGIYAKSKLEKTIISEFFTTIPSYFVKVALATNVSLGTNQFLPLVNYQLALIEDYEIIFQGYRKDRRKSLRKAMEAGLKHRDFNNKPALISLYKEVFDFVDLPEKSYQTIDKLIDYCIENEIGFIRNVFYKDELLCAGFFINYKSRIYYMFGASNPEGKKKGATTYLIDSVIKEFSNSDFIFDFEGSNIDSIASFYRSFGSDKTEYYKYNSNIIRETLL